MPGKAGNEKKPVGLGTREEHRPVYKSAPFSEQVPPVIAGAAATAQRRHSLLPRHSIVAAMKVRTRYHIRARCPSRIHSRV